MWKRGGWHKRVSFVWCIWPCLLFESRPPLSQMWTKATPPISQYDTQQYFLGGIYDKVCWLESWHTRHIKHSRNYHYYTLMCFEVACSFCVIVTRFRLFYLSDFFNVCQYLVSFRDLFKVRKEIVHILLSVWEDNWIAVGKLISTQ